MTLTSNRFNEAIPEKAMATSPVLLFLDWSLDSFNGLTCCGGSPAEGSSGGVLASSYAKNSRARTEAVLKPEYDSHLQSRQRESRNNLRSLELADAAHRREGPEDDQNDYDNENENESDSLHWSHYSGDFMRDYEECNPNHRSLCTASSTSSRKHNDNNTHAQVYFFGLDDDLELKNDRVGRKPSSSRLVAENESSNSVVSSRPSRCNMTRLSSDSSLSINFGAWGVKQSSIIETSRSIGWSSTSFSSNGSSYSSYSPRQWRHRHDKHDSKLQQLPPSPARSTATTVCLTSDDEDEDEDEVFMTEADEESFSSQAPTELTSHLSESKIRLTNRRLALPATDMTILHSVKSGTRCDSDLVIGTSEKRYGESAANESYYHYRIVVQSR